MITNSIKQVLAGENLSLKDAAETMDFIMDGKATNAQIAGLLVALKMKKEVSDEVAGFVQSMRNHSNKITLRDAYAVDGCGTGGDGKESFNVSTAAAIVTAGCGVTVAKHGNRSVSSKCGSSDLLEKTGANLDCPPEKVEKIINEVGFGFMFAPLYHPAMKYAGPPRKELGVRTVFNILGPMTNPATVKRQVIGVYDKSLMMLVAEVLRKTGSEHVMIVHAHDGMDEFSVSAPTDYVELKDGEIDCGLLSPEDVGLTMYNDDALLGGDAEENLSILDKVLAGEKSAYRDAVALNAGAMIYVSGKAALIKDAVGLALNAIDSGAAQQKLNEWIKATQD